MCEQLSANDAVALRREARRRKILENSTSRLKLIEGVFSSKGETSPENEGKQSMGAPAPEVEQPMEGTSEDTDRPKKMSEIREALKKNEDFKKISDYLIQEVSVEDPDVFEQERIKNASCLDENNIFTTLCKKRLHYVLLSVMVNLFFYLNVGHFFYDNVFCPFLTVKAIEVLSGIFKKEETEAMVFILISNLPNKLQRPGKIFLSLLPSLFSDLFLYLFTFIIGSKILHLQIEEGQ